MRRFAGFGKKPFFLGGQSLIEILIAISLASVLLPALLTGLVASREGKAQEGQRLEATALLKGAEEAVRSVYGSSWNNVAVNGTYYPEISDSSWVLTSCGGSCPTINGYTRQLVISDVYRDLGFSIVTSGGTLDPSTKKIENSVSWDTPHASSVDSAIYLERYVSNASFLQTTQADFNGGSHNNTQTVATGDGAVELTQSASTGADYGNKFRITGPSAIGTMTKTSGKTSLRFTAQNTKNVTALRVYVSTKTGTAPTYRFGIQTNNPAAGNIPSGTWVGGQGTLTNPAVGWQTANLTTVAPLNADQIYHLVVESTGAGGNGSISLQRSAPLNPLYLQTQAVDAMANTLYTTAASFSVTSIQNSQPIFELDFNDASQTFEGNPFYTSAISTISGNNRIGEKFTVTGGDKTATAITFLASRNAAGSPLDSLWVELRDAATNTIIEDGILPVTGTTYLYKTYTFSTPRVLTNGHTYRIFLKSPLSTTANGYRVYRGVGANFANYNSITYDGTNSIYTASGNAGNTWTDSNLNMDIAGYYFTILASTAYSTSGDFTSHSSGSFDTGVNNAAFNNITWTANVPLNTILRLQVAISNNPAGPWDYFGADGSLGSFFTAPGPIPLVKINGRYVRYKATFTSDGTVTPTLSDVSINYSP